MKPPNEIVQDVGKHACFICTAVWAYYINVHTLVYLLLGMWIADFICGYAKYVKETHTWNICSFRFRWSGAKLFVYIGITALIFFVGDMMRYDAETLFEVSRVWIWCCVYAEGLSIVENLLVVFPDNKALLILHWFLSVKFLTFIPKLSDYLKDKKEYEKRDRK